MQLINSTVIRELSTIIFFRELISGSLYLRGLYPGAYNRGLISRGLQPGAYIRVAYIPGAYIRELISRGLYPGGIYPGAYIRGLISGGL